MHYYTQVDEIQNPALPGRLWWRNCLLYLRPPANPPQTRDGACPDDCIGVVWLHNPSSANRPHQIPHPWGRIHVNPIAGDTLWTIEAIMEALLDNVPQDALPQTPYVAIEELVYIDSVGVHELWEQVPPEQIRTFSILNQQGIGNIQVAYPRSKFVWIAWGEKSLNANAGRQLPLLLGISAMRTALASGRDLVGVCRRWAPRPPDYSTYRYSTAHQAWTRHHHGQTTQEDPPEENGFEFPLHPFDFGTMLTGQPADAALTVSEDLLQALVDSFAPCANP